MHPIDDDDEPLSEPMQEAEKNAPAPHFHPDFDDDEILVLESIDCEQVLMDHLVFRQACKRLKFNRSADLFASATHKQLHRYYSRTPDTKALGTNAVLECYAPCTSLCRTTPAYLH